MNKTRKEKGREAFKAMLANFEGPESGPKIKQATHFPKQAKWDKKVPMPIMPTPR